MWLQALKELKEKSKKTIKQLAIETKLPTKTIERIFLGQTPNPTITTLIPIAQALGTSIDELFADTNAVVGTERIVELQNTIEELKAENELLIADNNLLKLENSNLSTRIELTETKLKYSEKLLAVFNFYNKNT